jgi:hypothetical protein
MEDYQIICLPIEGENIENGFDCHLYIDNQKDITSTELLFDYNGEQWSTHFLDLWTPADIVISVFLGFIVLYIIINSIISIFTRKRVQIYKKISKL